MNKKSKLFLLDQLLPSFSPAEQKIALFILENTFAVIDMTIEDMSEKIGTSVASISRFTKKIGFENFYLLKLGIAKEFVNSSNKTISLNVNKTLMLLIFIQMLLKQTLLYWKKVLNILIQIKWKKFQK